MPSNYLNQCWLLVNWTLGTNFCEIWMEVLTFSFKKMHLKMSSAKWRPFCPGGHELITTSHQFRWWLGGKWHHSKCQMRSHWPALCAGLLCCNFFGQPGSVSKFPPLLWVKLWVGWVGRGYTEISRYFPASWINWVTLVTKIKLLYSLRF